MRILKPQKNGQIFQFFPNKYKYASLCYAVTPQPTTHGASIACAAMSIETVLAKSQSPQKRIQHLPDPMPSATQ
jgi:hypothetical protein